MRKPPLRHLSVIISAVFMLGLAVWRMFAIPAPLQPYDGRTHRLTLESAGFSSEAPHGKQVTVKLEGVSGVLYYAGAQDYMPGELLHGAFRITTGYRQGHHFKAVTSFEIVSEEGPFRLRYRPVVWAQAVKSRLAGLYSGDNAALLTGILTGDRSDFSDSLTEDLFSSGMTHVAAVSGLHVSILAGFITFVTRSRRRAFFVSLPLIFLYVAVTGFTPSAARAGIMIAIFTTAPLFGREYHAFRASVAAFLILCAVNPYAVFEPALQLSFSATLGLTLFGRKWQKGFESFLLRKESGTARTFMPAVRRRAVRFIASSLAASFAALVFSMPFAAYWFGGVSLHAPLSNLLLLWLINFIFIGGALSLALPFLAPLTALILGVFRAAAALIGKAPYAVLYTDQPFLLAWLLYAYVMFVILILSRRWKLPALLTASMLVICLSLTAWRDGRVSLEIAVLDVGQGQCIVVRSGGQTAVIDCGGSGNAGQAAGRYLQSRGVRRVDHLLLTHYHDDHIDGVPALASTTPIINILGPALESVPDDLPVRTVTEVISFPLGKAEITVFPSFWLGDDNDRCLSFRVTLDGFSFLVTGDLGHGPERRLLRWTGLSGADVIIAGHHGSAGSTSAELLDALSPQAAVISSGVNSFGHPRPETLERLLERDIAIYRTDRRGHVIIRLA